MIPETAPQVRLLNRYAVFFKEPSGKAIAATNVKGMTTNRDLRTNLEIIWTYICPILLLHLLSLQKVALRQSRVLYLWLIDAQSPIFHEVHDVNMSITAVLLRTVRHRLLAENACDASMPNGISLHEIIPKQTLA